MLWYYKDTRNKIVLSSWPVLRLVIFFFQIIENTVMARLNDFSRYHQSELQTAKNEFREGFTSAHDSISNAKRVVEGKLKLQEDKLKKDVNQVRKLVVLH